MTTNYVTYKNQSCFNAFGASFCDDVYSATLKAAADTVVNVPLTQVIGAPSATSFNKFLAVIVVDASADVFVSINATAVVPAGATFAKASSELVPANQLYAKSVKAGDIIHFISPGTPSVTVAFYAIQE